MQEYSQQPTTRERRPVAKRSAPYPMESDLRKLGVVSFNLALPETHSLPHIIHPNERIEGIVYGRYKQAQGQHEIVGRGALVATDQRVILVDKKPLFIRDDEIAYGSVSGVTYGRVFFIGNVRLHTRLGDISVRTINQNCARMFVEAVEAHIFNQT